MALFCPLHCRSQCHFCETRAGGSAPFHREENQGSERMGNSPQITQTVDSGAKTKETPCSVLLCCESGRVGEPSCL